MWWATRWAAPCALRMALDAPQRVGRLVLMGPGGIGISQNPPTAGLKRLLGYYAGEGPTLDKLRTFICEDLVFDASRIERRRAAGALCRQHRRPRCWPTRRCARPSDLEAFKRLDFLLRPAAACAGPPGRWCCGARKTASIRPAARWPCKPGLPACDVYLFSRTGHWVQWERADEFNAVVAAFLAADA